MNCTIKEYTMFEGDVRTDKKFRILFRNRQVVKAEGEFTGEMSNWALTREKWGRGEKNIPGMERERREAIKMAQYFGQDTPPKRVPVAKTEINEEGEVVMVQKKERHHYSLDTLHTLSDAVIASGKTLREYLEAENRLDELASIRSKGRTEGISFPAGKKGRKAGVPKYSEEDMKALGSAIAVSGLTLVEYLLKQGRMDEKTALYTRFKKLGITVRMGKRGRQKGQKVVKHVAEASVPLAA